MTSSGREARAVAEQYVKQWFCHQNEILWERGGHYKEEIEALIVLLTNTRREVWEEAAKIADTLHSYEARNVYLLRAQQEKR